MAAPASSLVMPRRVHSTRIPSRRFTKSLLCEQPLAAHLKPFCMLLSLVSTRHTACYNDGGRTHEERREKGKSCREARTQSHGPLLRGGQATEREKMGPRKTPQQESRSSGRPSGRLESMRLWLLGGFRVFVGSRTIEENAWRLRKATSLVKLLALSPGHRLHHVQDMDLLWPDSGRRAASNSLRRTLHSARRALDPAKGSRYLASEDEQGAPPTRSAPL